MKKSQIIMVFIIVIVMVLNSFIVEVSFAAPTQPHGVISLTFDDSWENQYQYAFPLMKARGIPGTFYVITNKLQTTVNGSASFMSFTELQTMQNSGNEIGSHSETHPNFTNITDSQIIQECTDSKQLLQSHNLTVNNFAYPYGAYNGHTDTIVSQYYRSARLVYCPGYLLQLPFSQFSLPADEGDIGDQNASALGFSSLLSYLESIVDKAYANNEWAVIYFHQILPNTTNQPELINTQTFASFLDYIQSKGVPTLTVNQALNLVSPPAPPPSVTINPTSIAMDIGQSRGFSSSISGGNPALSYQWCLNDSAISGATNTSWTFTPPSTGNFKVYLNVTDALGYKVQSNPVTDISVYTRPTVLINPSTVNTTLGASQTFISAVSDGAIPDTFQWFLNDTAISGATNANYTFSPTIVGTHNIYVSVTDNANVTVNSNKSTVKVETPINVTITPSHVSTYLGQFQTFTSTVTGGTAPYAYQWILNSSAVSGANSANWVFSPPTIGNFTIYLNINDGFNLNSQSNIVTNISVYSQLTVSINPESTDMTIGGTQQFTCRVAGGVAPYTYQWYYANGTAISGAMNSGLAYGTNQIGTINIYLNITDSLNAKAQSNTATLNVNTSPTSTPTSTPTASPTSEPTSTSTTTPTSSPTVSPTNTPDSTSKPTIVVTPTDSPQAVSSYIVPFSIAGLVVAIAVILVATDVLVIRKRLLSPDSTPPPPESE